MLVLRRFPFPPALLVAALLGLGACDSNEVSCPPGTDCASAEAVLACDLQAGPNSQAFPLRVQYSADLSGDAHITELNYETNSGTLSTDTLRTSWSKEVSLNSRSTVEITADVEVTDGTAKISFVGRDSTGAIRVQATDQCGKTGG